MIGPSGLVENAHCVTKHSLHRLFLDLRGRYEDDELTRVLVLGYDLGREWLRSASPDCDPGMVKSAVDGVTASARRFVEAGGLEALEPELLKRLLAIGGPKLLPPVGMGFLVALFEKPYR